MGVSVHWGKGNKLFRDFWALALNWPWFHETQKCHCGPPVRVGQGRAGDQWSFSSGLPPSQPPNPSCGCFPSSWMQNWNRPIQQPVESPHWRDPPSSLPFLLHSSRFSFSFLTEDQVALLCVLLALLISPIKVYITLYYSHLKEPVNKSWGHYNIYLREPSWKWRSQALNLSLNSKFRVPFTMLEALIPSCWPFPDPIVHMG